jgi:hypothetical protein
MLLVLEPGVGEVVPMAGVGGMLQTTNQHTAARKSIQYICCSACLYKFCYTRVRAA